MSIGGHHSARSGNVEWLTPPEILAALGPFDLDPCAVAEHRRPWPTARHHLTEADDGLATAWEGVPYVNAPYSTVGMHHWMKKLADYGRGVALTFARTETEWFCRYGWDRATAMLFMDGPRQHFYSIHAAPHVGEPWKYCGIRAKANCGGPTVLIAYGLEEADRLANCGIKGRFIPLTACGQVVAVFRPTDDITWRGLLAELAAREGGTLPLRAAYVLVDRHPKAAINPNWKAQVRKILQGPAFERIAPATYRLKGAA